MGAEKEEGKDSEAQKNRKKEEEEKETFPQLGRSRSILDINPSLAYINI